MRSQRWKTVIGLNLVASQLRRRNLTYRLDEAEKKSDIDICPSRTQIGLRLGQVVFNLWFSDTRHFGRACFDGFHQCIISKVAISHGRLMIGVTQNFTDGE